MSEWVAIKSVGRGRSVRVSPHVLSYGSFVRATVFSVSSRIACKELSAFFDFSTRVIRIRCGCSALEVATKELEEFVVVDRSDDTSALYITLRHPARLYDLHADDEDLEFARRATDWKNAVPRRIFAACRTIRLVVQSGTANTILEFLSGAEKSLFEAQIDVTYGRIDAATTPLPHPSWSVQYAWLCLTSTNGFVRERFTAAFYEKLQCCSEKLAVGVLYALGRMMSRDLFLDPALAFEEALRRGCVAADLEDTQLHCRVPRLVITPTRWVFYEPDIIQTNRVMREWGPKVQFLRVTIRDENFAKLSPTKGQLENVLRQIFQTLLEGLQVGARTFRFLGCSNNQVRDHGCFFVDATDRPEIVEEIRTWAGNLDCIDSVAQYVSRLGQVFSTSTRTVKVDPRHCLRIEDVRRNGYCFTDGIGKISMDLAKDVAVVMGLQQTVPCAFQIRFGGCKGVMAVDPDLQKRHPGKRLCFRDSMRKYWSDHMTIEVLSSCARPQELYLNQQLIMLLSHRGVKDGIFMKLLTETLTNLSNMFIDEDKAREKLSSISCGIDWEQICLSNFIVTTDPYFRSLLMALYRLQMKGLRDKSRIPMDPARGRVLMGTVDERGVLNYGEVFVQYSKYLYNPGGEKVVLRQNVVIGKSPCLHPGDVRTFKAVDCPILRHMSDCVVFPSTGHRPHPNELSGSDLDGDLYHVLWGDELMPSVPNNAAMVYSSAKTETTADPIDSKAMLKFLQANIQFDCLGQIDNTHKALADLMGIGSEPCVQLAQLHSQAVDAPKTGNWASVPRAIRKMLDKYPDFMMKQDKPSYPSEKILGVMFRECNKFLNACSLLQSNWDPVDLALEQNLLTIDGTEPFLEDARKWRRHYNNKLSLLMTMYGITTEAEFMTGFVEKLHEKIGKEVYDVTALIAHLREKLLQKYKEIFFQDERIQLDGVVDAEKAMRKAAAWYYVCYCPTEKCESYTIGSTEKRFLSFAWIASEYLLKLYVRKSSQQTADGAKQRIGRSIYANLDSVWNDLLAGLDAQLCVREHLMSLFQTKDGMTLEPYLYGLSYNLLFDERIPTTELVLGFGGLEDYLFNSKQVDGASIREITYKAKAVLHNNQIECQIQQSGRRYLLHSAVFVPALRRRMKIQVTADPFCWLQTALILQYIYDYAWLLPLLRVVIRWARATEFVETADRSLLDSLTICFMVIDYGLRSGYIWQAVDHKEVLDIVGKDRFSGFADVETWTEIGQRLHQTEPDFAAMGELLLGFFSDVGQNKSNYVHPALSPILGHTYYHQTCSVEAMTLLQEEMQRAFHKLAFHCSIHPLFTSVEAEKVLYLAPPFSNRMNGSEQFFARLFSRKAGAKVEIHRRGRDTEKEGLLIKVTATQPRIHQVEGRLERFRSSCTVLDGTLAHYPGIMELYVLHSVRFMIEGISAEKGKQIGFEDYWGARHPVDDNVGIYTLQVLSPAPSFLQSLYDLNSAQYLEFKAFLLERVTQIRKSPTEGHSLFLHGQLSFEIQFGKIYLVNLPSDMTEDPEGVAPDQLLRHIAQETRIELTHPQKWKHALETGALVQETPPLHRRAAFFAKLLPEISQKSLLHLLTVDYGLEQTEAREFFDLSLRGIRHGLTVEYTSDLSLAAVFFPPLYWMQFSLKRQLAERRELDISYSITSKLRNERREIQQEVSRALYQRSDHSHVVHVAPERVPAVNSMKHIQQRVFNLLQADMSPFWQCASVVLEEVVMRSRPSMCAGQDLSMTERFCDLRLKIDWSKFCSLMSSHDVIGEMWFQATSLSDSLRRLCQRNRHA